MQNDFQYQPKHTCKKFKFPTQKRVAKQIKQHLKSKEKAIEKYPEL